MSCVLSNIGSFQDINSVRKHLFPSPSSPEKETDEDDNIDGWEEANWEWESEDEKEDLSGKEEDEKDSGSKYEESWFHDCALSLSPTNEVLVIANEEKVVFLHQKWDPDGKDGTDSKYQIVYKGALGQEEGECITSVVCLPLASQKRSSQGAPDWTCVVVGFTSGFVRMYTENGALLLSQLFHEDPILKIKCRTLDVPRFPGLAEQQEELTILYPSTLVTIDGFSLFQSLRACRNQVARASAGSSDSIQPPPLTYKKWGLQKQDAIIDHTTTGLVTPCSFDQLHTASVLGGWKASIKPTPPVSNRYVTAGAGPFVGFFYALEGSSHPLLSDVALAVANKLKSALFSAASGWLGLGGRPKPGDDSGQKPRPKVEPSTSLPIRFGLPDLRRHGDSVNLAPGLNLAVSTDSFGRVVLIDINKGVAVRMWKGYRDAQCGWVQVTEEIHHEKGTDKSSHRERSKGKRVALFLIIYAPRRGILEVWNTQEGPRVAAFNVPKTCRLLYPGYGVMGLNSLTIHDSRYRPAILQCCLLESTGLLRTISVPFHLSLSDKNSRRAHDLHLMKKLSSLIHHRNTVSDHFSDSVLRILSEFKLPSYRQQALDKVLSIRGMPSQELFTIVENFMKKLESQSSDSVDYESRCFRKYCSMQVLLLKAYIQLQELQSSSRMETSQVTEKDLTASLGFEEQKLQQISATVDRYHETSAAARTVKFEMDSNLDASRFVSCFKVTVSGEAAALETPMVTREATAIEASDADESEAREEKRAKTDYEDDEELICSVCIKEDLINERLLSLGAFLFKSSLQGQVSIDELHNILSAIRISSRQSVKLLLQVWLHNEQDLLKNKMSTSNNLLMILQTITKESTFTEGLGDHVYLGEIQKCLYQTEKVGAAVLAAVVLKSVIQGWKAEETESSTEEEGNDVEVPVSPSSMELAPEWERASSESGQWEKLIDQLEHLTLLSQLLQKDVPESITDKLQVEDHEKDGVACPVIGFNSAINLRKALEGGRGIFAETVAKWLCHSRLPPSVLSDSAFQLERSFHCQTSQSESTSIAEDIERRDDKLETLKDLIGTLTDRFPSSLEHDTLQSHCSWEYIVQWNKNPEVTQFFRSALEHLKMIRNPLLQHGVASMLWHTFLVKKVSAATFLMDKVGKAPKDRLCRKDVGLSDGALAKVLGFCAEVLEIIYQAESDPALSPLLEVEDLWQSIQGPSSLVELALTQPSSNPLLVDIHKQLCMIMSAVMQFQLKSLRVLSLFDFRSKATLFKELNYPYKPLQAGPDVGLVNTRKELLKRVLSSAIQTLPPNYTKETSEEGEPKEPSSPRSKPRPDKKHPSQVWPSKVYQLAGMWYVEVDDLKRHHVCELYRGGYDFLTQELLVTVTNQTDLAVELIHILGQRLAQKVIVPADASSVDRQSRLPASLVSWLKTLAKEELRCPNPPIQDTAHLAGQAVGLMLESHPQYPLALQLIEAVGSLT